MDRARILYVNHDMAAPAGGVRTIYTHVEHLTRHGFPAFVVHNDPRFRPSWFTSSAPTLSFKGGLTISERDLLVVPEDHRPAIDALGPLRARKLIFCQNHYYLFEGLGGGARHYRERGFDGVLCSSEAIRDFVSLAYGEEAPIIPYAVDGALFRPGTARLQIAYMPRKRPADAVFIRELFARLFPKHADVPWIAIENRSEAEVAQILGSSALFLSLGYREGFGLPPVEAMSAGCIVVGFDGDGGREYARPETGLWLAEGDLVGFARALGRAVDLIRARSPEIDAMRAAGAAMAARYSPARQESELVRIWQGLYAP